MSKDSPIVTFSRGGRAVELGRTWRDPVLHIHGSTGLGVAPVSIGKSDRLVGDGSVVRGVRYADRDVFIPLLARMDSMRDLHLWRRDLTRTLAPVSGDPEASRVDVTVEDPTTGTVRTIRGIFREGLEGDFGDTYHGHWQTFGLVFDCADPWWLGPARTASLSLGGETKPFLSETVDFFPVILAPSSVAGDLHVNVGGDGDVWPVWEITGPGEDLMIEGPGGKIEIDGTFTAGEVVRIDTGRGRITPDRWDDVSLDSTLFSLRPGTSTINASMVNATEDTVIRVVWQERFFEAV